MSPEVVGALDGVGKCIRGSHILVLGVAYKRGVNDVRESPALEIVDGLIRRGAAVTYHDPHIPAFSVNGTQFASCDLAPARLAAQDCVVIATDHAEVDYQVVVENAQVVVDTRGATRGATCARGRIVCL